MSDKSYLFCFYLWCCLIQPILLVTFFFLPVRLVFFCESHNEKFWIIHWLLFFYAITMNQDWFKLQMALFHCTVRLGMVPFWGVSTGYSTWYLVLFSVPPRLRVQASCTITKTWCVNSADHWLAGENLHCLRHWTCDTRHNRPARFKSAQPAKHWTQRFWMSTPFFYNQKLLFCCLLRKYRRSSRW